MATALLDELDQGPVDPDALRASVEQATARVARRSRRASASGALVGLLLVGLLGYALVSRIPPGRAAAPSTFFDALVVLGVLVLAIGIFLNQRLSTETRAAARRMLEAATPNAKEPA